MATSFVPFIGCSRSAGRGPFGTGHQRLARPDDEASIGWVCMSTRRRNAVTDFEAAAGSSVAYLASLGFTRSGHLFHRRSHAGDVADKIEGIALCFEYGFRTCWLHATVKFPGLIGLLSEVRPFAYRRTLAARVPDHGSHLCCLHRLTDLRRGEALHLPEGIRERYDGRLQRARPVDADTLQRVMLGLVQDLAVPALERRFTLAAVAAASDRPGYEHSGIAGAWPLAARLALQDLEGAARAFRRHPLSLGGDERRFAAAKQWLIGRGVDVGAVEWVASEHEQPFGARNEGWLSGELV